MQGTRDIVAEERDILRTLESIAHDVELVVQAAYEETTAEVLKFTPSVKAGRRYIGLKAGSREFLITIEVEEG